MRVLLPLLVVSATTGCDAVFSVDHVGPPPPADAAPPCPSAIGHDEDGDGVDDACDPCPFAAANTGDDDGDGIALACDPDPMTANELLLFHGFGPGALSQFTILGGELSGDAYRFAGRGGGALVWGTDVDAVWVIAGVEVTAIDDEEQYREVGVVFDAKVTAASTQADGTYCVLGRAGTTSDYVQVFVRAREVGANDVVVNSSSSSLALLDMQGTLRGSHVRSAIPASSCTFETGTNSPTISGTPAARPPSGGLGLYAQSVDVAFRYLFVARRP